MDEPNQIERCNIQVATNKFHNVFNKDINKKMHVCCYKYHKETYIENEGGGYCRRLSKTNAC